MKKGLQNREIAMRLLNMRTAAETKSFLQEFFSRPKNGLKWIPVGGRPTNASSIDLAWDEAPPLIERITNSIDAMLELFEANIPQDKPKPKSPREAAEIWCNIPKGHLENLSNEQTQQLANNIRIRLFGSGNRQAPTILIIDKGIGQHPKDFDKTLLSLGESNKIGKHYLCGAYGQGGSSTLSWCEYTIVVSRRRPEHNGQGTPDLVGWTIIRKQEYLQYKTTVYEYLVDRRDGTVPVLPPQAFQGLDFDFGTHIAHIQYDLGKTYSGPASLVSYRLFQSLLFDPVLPFWLEDMREFERIPKFRRTISGNVARLNDNPNVEYSNEYVADLGSDGRLKIRYWVMKIKPREEGGKEKFYQWSYLEKEKSPHIVVITLNGQRHDTVDKRFIKQATQLSFLANYLLVQVECDALSLRLKRDLFVAHRGRVRRGERRLDLIRDKVVEALRTDEILIRLEATRREQYLSQLDEESERNVRQLLNRLITVTQEAEHPGSGTREGTGPGHVGEKEFQPKDPPTFINFICDEEVLPVPKGESKVLTLETDGPDDMLTRIQNRAHLSCSFSKNSGMAADLGSLRHGRMRIRFSASNDIQVGIRDKLVCSLDMLGLAVALRASQKIRVVEPPAPYVPNDPPTIFKITNREPVLLQQGMKNMIKIRMDGPNDLLTRPFQAAQFGAYCSIPGSSVPDRRGPRDGEMQVFVYISKTVPLETTGTIKCILTLADGKIVETQKQCKVIERKQPKRRDLHGTRKKQRVPNYELIPVYKDDWYKYDWDEKNVGKSEISQKKLFLFVNLDQEALTADLERRKRRNEDEDHMNRIKRKYFAHIGYHLWLQHRARKTNHTSLPQDVELEDLENFELQRVAKTILLLMQPERSLA